MEIKKANKDGDSYIQFGRLYIAEGVESLKLKIKDLSGMGISDEIDLPIVCSNVLPKVIKYAFAKGNDGNLAAQIMFAQNLPDPSKCPDANKFERLNNRKNM